MNFIEQLFNSHHFMPHGFCYLWNAPLIAMNVAGDVAAFFAYMTAPVLLFWLVNKRKDLPFSWMFLCFGSFIFFCGCLHLMEVITIWYPLYWVSGIIKLLTAIASVMAAVLLPGVVPKVLALPTPEALSKINVELASTNQALKAMTEQLAQARDIAMEESHLKSQFVSRSSHDIRTPLAGVLGMAELLLETPMDDDQRELAQCIPDAASYLLNIINDILDLSNIEEGAIELNRAGFDLSALVTNVYDLVLPQIKNKQISLTCSVDPAIAANLNRDSVNLSGDAVRLKQVLLNLCTNAVKFTDHGQVDIKAALDHIEGEKARVRFSVSDTGVGLSQASIERLFQPFTQADGSTTRRYGGTGLGLSISKKLVELMGGEIGVTSEPDKGSTFWFWLDMDCVSATTGDAMPFTQADISSDRPVAQVRRGSKAERPPVTEIAGGSGKLALIVEDNRILRDLMLRRLRLLGMTAHAVSNGREAIEAIGQVEYCLVLMDCQMPHLDGYQATVAIRAAETANARRLPIIAMTASSMNDDRKRCLEAGMDDYLSKPFDLQQLRDVLSRWL